VCQEEKKEGEKKLNLKASAKSRKASQKLLGQKKKKLKKLKTEKIQLL